MRIINFIIVSLIVLVVCTPVKGDVLRRRRRDLLTWNRTSNMLTKYARISTIIDKMADKTKAADAYFSQLETFFMKKNAQKILFLLRKSRKNVLQ